VRHLRAGKKLSVDTQHRLALRRNLARSLFLKGRIVTTPTKAKAVRPFVEKLVTRAKYALELKAAGGAPYIHQVRVLRRDVSDRKALALLVDKIAPLCKDRAGGYTRILHDAKRQIGDRAPRVIFEFVDKPSAPAEGTPEEAKAKKPAPKGKKGGEAPETPAKGKTKAAAATA
jgi:large subunit ribosomal protein L17